MNENVENKFNNYMIIYYCNLLNRCDHYINESSMGRLKSRFLSFQIPDTQMFKSDTPAHSIIYIIYIIRILDLLRNRELVLLASSGRKRHCRRREYIGKKMPNELIIYNIIICSYTTYR